MFVFDFDSNVGNFSFAKADFPSACVQPPQLLFRLESMPGDARHPANQGISRWDVSRRAEGYLPTWNEEIEPAPPGVRDGRHRLLAAGCLQLERRQGNDWNPQALRKAET